MKKYVVPIVAVLAVVLVTFSGDAVADTCNINRGELYRGDDGFWRLPFSNGCNDTVFVTVTYKGRRPGVCIGAHSSGEVTLYYGENEPDGPIDWEARYSNCGG